MYVIRKKRTSRPKKKRINKKLIRKKTKKEEKDKKEEEENLDNDNDKPNDENEEEDSEFDLSDLDINAPPEFMCPLTLSIMKDPVIMPDGQTYEREAIKLVLERKPISPITKEPMDISQAEPNKPLKNLINKYIAKHKKETKDDDDSEIDPSTMFQNSQKNELQIPYTEIHKVKLDNFTAQYTDDSMLITIKPQKFNGRLPVSIIAVIDISTSMIIDATCEESDLENLGMSRIQLVQNSLKTIISTLGSSDKLTIVTFSKRAKILASGINLTQKGKEEVGKIIDDIDPDGETNLWDGLDKGINEALKQQNNQINTSLLVFTDGNPNINPPFGLIPTLKRKLKNIDVLFSISVFGYGYNIDADLMEEIAEIGNGIYGYIPDASKIGTIFINYISNLVSFISPLATLTVDFDDQKPKKYNILLYNGSATNVMVSLDKSNIPKKAKINLDLKLTNESIPITDIRKLNNNDQSSVILFRDQKYRKKLIDLISETKEGESIDVSHDNVIELYDQIRKEKKENRSQFMNYLMLDLYNDDKQHGTIERAYQKVNFNKWGQNYLLSLLSFHKKEQNGNFKDMSLQLYGSENDCFIKCRKIGSKIFMNLMFPEKKCFFDFESEFDPNKFRFSSDDDMRAMQDDDEEEDENQEENSMNNEDASDGDVYNDRIVKINDNNDIKDDDDIKDIKDDDDIKDIKDDDDIKDIKDDDNNYTKDDDNDDIKDTKNDDNDDIKVIKDDNDDKKGNNNDNDDDKRIKIVENSNDKVDDQVSLNRKKKRRKRTMRVIYNKKLVTH